ncbi:unnamed protein product [Prunus brigantina]
MRRRRARKNEAPRNSAVANSNSTYVIPSMKELTLEFINMTFGWTGIIQNVGMLGSSSLKVEHFIAGLSILDDFVNIPMDVELLVKKRIFLNTLGDHNEVSTLIKDLGKVVFISDFYFGSVREELDRYLKSPGIKWKCTLKTHFFNSPWATKEMNTFIMVLVKDYGIGANFSSIQWKWVPRKANKAAHDQSKRGPSCRGHHSARELVG